MSVINLLDRLQYILSHYTPSETKQLDLIEALECELRDARRGLSQPDDLTDLGITVDTNGVIHRY